MVAGPTACGKDSVIAAFCEQYPWVQKITSYTTRPKRAQDIEGFHYHFLTNDEFLQNQDDFVFRTDRIMGQTKAYYGMHKQDFLAVGHGGAYICHVDLDCFGKLSETIQQEAADPSSCSSCLERTLPIYLGVPRLTVLKDRYFARHRLDDEKCIFKDRLRTEWHAWQKFQETIPNTIMNSRPIEDTVNEIISLLNQRA